MRNKVYRIDQCMASLAHTGEHRLADITHLEQDLRQRLRVIQRQPGLINGCLGSAGLVLNIQPP